MAERIDQKLAVAAAEVLPAEVNKELRTRMRGLPVMIHTSGLAATCAFLLSRAAKPELADPYYATAMAMLKAGADAAREPVDDDPNVTLTRLAAAPGHKYLLAETRARELALWLSRLAQARYRGEANGDREAPA